MQPLTAGTGQLQRILPRSSGWTGVTGTCHFLRMAPKRWLRPSVSLYVWTL